MFTVLTFDNIYLQMCFIISKNVNLINSVKISDQLPLDSESYIKYTLGKPLRQALAAITIYQPSDPINYLANYLLQYRYNALRNIQRQQDFENLAVQRERYAEKVQLVCSLIN